MEPKLKEPREGRVQKLFYGYWLVVSWFLAFTFFTFLSSTSVNIYRDVVSEMQGYSPALILQTTAIAAVIVALVLLIIPKYLRILGARNIMVIGAIGAGIVFIIIPYSPNPLTLTVLIGLDQFFSSLYCAISTMMLISVWFPRTKGRIMGIVTAGGVLSTTVFLPIFSKIYVSFGIVNAMLVFGIIVIVYGIINFFLMKNTPQEIGLFPDNKPMSDEERQHFFSPQATTSEWTNKELLRNSKFWLVTIGWTLAFFGILSLALTFIGFWLSAGVEYDTAITGAMFVGVLTLIISIVSGLIDQKIGPSKTAVFFVGYMAIAVLLLGLLRDIPLMALVILVVLALGATGSTQNLSASQVLDMFGAKSYPVVYVLFMAFLSLRNFSTFLPGWSLEATGSYHMAYVILGIICMAGVVMITIAGRKRVPPPRRNNTDTAETEDVVET